MNIAHLIEGVEPPSFPQLYHRFYLSTNYDELNVVHTTYTLHRRTPCGAWIRERGSWGEERWVADVGNKKYAYPDVKMAWNSFKIRMERRAMYAKNHYDAMVIVERALGQELEPPKSSVRLDNTDANRGMLSFDVL
jgi:hypothetical protein